MVPNVRFVLISFAVLFLASCTLQKRSFKNGYYVHWKSFHKLKGPNDKKNLTALIEENGAPLTEHVPDRNDELVIASADGSFIITSVRKDSIREVECGDSIWSVGGSVSQVKVLEITETLIKYKRCSNWNGPVIIANKRDVEKIKFSNGTIETYDRVIKAEPAIKNKVPGSEATIKAPSNTLAKIALICGLVFLGCGLFALFAYLAGTNLWVFFMALGAASYFATWITSLTAIFSISAKPEKHTGKGMAWAAFAMVAGYTLLVIGLLVLLLQA